MRNRGSHQLVNEGPGFERFSSYAEAGKLDPPMTVYRAGTGPGVIVMHELYGATPTLFRFAHRIAQAGFTAFVPVLFGTPNHEETPLYCARQAVRVCLSREFAVLASNRSSPIASSVRSLGRLVHEELGGGIGAVGLCLTGNFALTMMLDEHVQAPVVSEAALPLWPFGSARSALHLSPSEKKRIQERVAGGAEILAFRFDGDPIVPVERYDALQATFAPRVIGNSRLLPTCPRAHAVFTDHYDDTAGISTRGALDDLIAFLKRKLP